MDAIIISIKGDLKPIALRHHVFEMGNTLGIRGFLNYRNGMNELLIHAEGKIKVMVEFTNQINQLANKHKLACSMESIILEDFTDFKISHLDVGLNHNFDDNNKSLNPNSIPGPFAKALVAEQK